jgi:hypothetical protein
LGNSDPSADAPTVWANRKSRSPAPSGSLLGRARETLSITHATLSARRADRLICRAKVRPTDPAGTNESLELLLSAFLTKQRRFYEAQEIERGVALRERPRIIKA